jgi:septum formation protein
MTKRTDFYLASASPRRRELLQQLGYHFALLPVEVCERPLVGEGAEALVRRLALAKARKGRERVPSALPLPVLGADTEVVLDDRVLGKPADADDAARMLAQLSGREHRVLTAVAVADAGGEEVVISETRVRMRPIDSDEIQAYVAGGEGGDKAGAYAIQGRAAIFVERIEGSYSGVVGLPLFETARLLSRFGICCLQSNKVRGERCDPQRAHST